MLQQLGHSGLAAAKQAQLFLCKVARQPLFSHPAAYTALPIHRFQPNTDITAMLSVEGEVVPLKKRIKPSEAGGAVEKWLVQVGRQAAPATRDCPGTPWAT